MEKNLSTLKGLREIDALSVRMLKRNILFFCFITVLGLIYIANAHYAENKIRRIASLKSELKELNWEHMSLRGTEKFRREWTRLAGSVSGISST